MRASANLYSSLVNLSAGIRPQSETEREELARVEKLLVRSRIDANSGLTVQALSVERATWYEAHELDEGRRIRLAELANAGQSERAQFRVFRRDAPLANAAIDFATPSWARGAAVARTAGPFTSLDGRQFWFDFFSLIRLVPVHLAGDPQPAFLFHLREHRGALDAPVSIDQFIGLFGQRYSIAGSTIWFRANLLTPAAPAGTYIGLRIIGGTLTFTPPPTVVDEKLTIPANGHCFVHLDLGASDAVASGGGQAGVDAANALTGLPLACSFVLANGRATVTNLAHAEWTLYGQPLKFEWQQGSTPFFEPLLHAVIVPMTVSEPDLLIDKAASPFATMAGQAPIRRGGWLLPVATIDITHPTEASGIGGLGVQTDEGLTLTWRGLREGPIRLPAPWMTAAPGVISIIDPAASARYARQTFRLWKDVDSRFRSELALAYTDKFSVTYVSGAGGTEIVVAQTNVEARLDRPVDVKGTPLPIRTLGSILMLAYTDQAQHVSVYDDNILVDALDPQPTWPVERGRAALAGHPQCAVHRHSGQQPAAVRQAARRGDGREGHAACWAWACTACCRPCPIPMRPTSAGCAGTRARRRFRRQVASAPGRPVTWTKAAADEAPDAERPVRLRAARRRSRKRFEAWRSAAQQVAAGAGGRRTA